MDPIALPCGIVLQPEVKTRRKLATITKWLEQARAYMPNATPLVVASEKGGPQIAILPLEAFARIAGIEKAAA